MDVDRVEALVKLLHGAHARELVVETEGWKVSLTKGAAAARRPRPAPPPLREEDPVEEEDRLCITAPLVGIFRCGDARLRVGEWIERGQVVGSIDAMKISHPLTSEAEGEVTALLVEDGQPVEYGQPLLEIRVEEETG